MNPRSGSNETNTELKPPHPWLQKHYQEKRERTVRLVKAAVDQLMSEKQVVTIEAICHKSAEVDMEGRGVKKSAILVNTEAHAYYQQHSTSYRALQSRKRQGSKKGRPLAPTVQPMRIDPTRDVDRVRYRYLQKTKSDLVERLLLVEEAYAESQQQLARLQFEWVEKQQHQREKTPQQQQSTGQTGQ
jgi:hypothetical protein